jgi:hypothetical protein
MTRRVFAVGRRRPWRALTITVLPKKEGGTGSQSDTARERLETSRERKVVGRAESIH